MKRAILLSYLCIKEKNACPCLSSKEKNRVKVLSFDADEGQKVLCGKGSAHIAHSRAHEQAVLFSDESESSFLLFALSQILVHLPKPAVCVCEVQAVAKEENVRTKRSVHLCSKSAIDGQDHAVCQK